MYSDYRKLLQESGNAIRLLFFRLVASGSDDVQVIIWDPFLHKSVTTVRTGHQGNIFSVKVMTYVPKTPDAPDAYFIHTWHLADKV